MKLRRALVAACTLGMMVSASGADGGTPGSWTKVGNSAVNFAQPGLARTSDGRLHAVWVRSNVANPASDDIVHTAIAPDGTVGPTDAVQEGWASIWAVPDLVLTADGGLRAFWGGIRSTSGSETNTNISTASAPSAGMPWTLQVGDVSRGAGGASSAVGATTAADGTVLFSWADSSVGHVHRGLDPATPNFEFDAPTGSCCEYSSDLARDTATGEIWVAWYSNADDAEGVWAQQIDPATGQAIGSPSRMPGSFTLYNGQEESSQEIQRTPIAAREGGGVYVVYSSGYPTTQEIRLWKVPSTSSVVVARSSTQELSKPGVAADPNGRLWVMWHQRNADGNPVVLARRSNLTADRFGATVKAAPPQGVDCLFLYNLTANAQTGLLDVIGNFSDGCSGGLTAFWHTQLRPGLTFSADPNIFRRKATVVFTVKDAGDPVSGARVTVGGKSGTTNAQGKVEITLGPYSSARRLTAKVTKTGYRSASLTLRVKA
ncbi:MAG TPA: hypothetical protein VHJ82_09295 [Actinomycetota bacterium]|nr:hypothetical protein [Actinomycetota bacterium]